jgi:hypothetical protein
MSRSEEIIKLLTEDDIISILNKAKEKYHCQAYFDNIKLGMCGYINYEIFYIARTKYCITLSGDSDVDDVIKKRIPMFLDREFLNADCKEPEAYYWRKSMVNERLNAFDLLIDYHIKLKTLENGNK